MTDPTTKIADELEAEWREPFLVRTNGGPAEGQRVVRDGDVYGGLLFTWPLPNFLSDRGGRYRKVGESRLAPQTQGSHVVRGAEYEWESS